MDDAGILFVEDARDKLCSFKAIKKVHEINRHRGKDQLILAFRNAGWMSPDIVNMIDRVFNYCCVCQKFKKSVARPRVTLPKVRSFNEIVTLDLKEFGKKYVLWIIDSFTRFIQGKLINNKRANMIILALMDTWCMNVSFPTQGFFADNGSEFANVKLDKSTSKLGLSVRFGPAYSSWSKGLNERNHASADLTIKKLIEEKKVPLSDLLVKATS